MELIMSKQKFIYLTFTKDHLKYKKGETIKVKCDANGTALELAFRRLIKDSEKETFDVKADKKVRLSETVTVSDKPPKKESKKEPTKPQQD
jgi:hypothetical protein